MARKERRFKIHTLLRGDVTIASGAPQLAGGTSQDGPGAARRKEKLIRRAGGAVCAGCGRDGLGADYLEIGHDRPRARGGGDHVGNRLLLCWVCHRLKADSLTLAQLQDRIYELAGKPGGKWHAWAMKAPLVAGSEEEPEEAASAPPPNPEFDKYRGKSVFVLGEYAVTEFSTVMRYIWSEPPPPPPVPLERDTDYRRARRWASGGTAPNSAAAMDGRQGRQEGPFEEFLDETRTFGFSSIKEALAEARSPYIRVVDEAEDSAASAKSRQEGGES